MALYLIEISIYGLVYPKIFKKNLNYGNSGKIEGEKALKLIIFFFPQNLPK